jgi:hypothetical protein
VETVFATESGATTTLDQTSQYLVLGARRGVKAADEALIVLLAVCNVYGRGLLLR